MDNHDLTPEEWNGFGKLGLNLLISAIVLISLCSSSLFLLSRIIFK